MKNKTTSVFLNTITNYARYFIHIGVIVVILPYIVHKLGKEAYGLWGLVLSTVGFFGFLDMGFSTAVVKYVAQYSGNDDREKLTEFSSTLQFLYWAIALVVALATTALAYKFTSLVQLPVKLAEASFWVVLSLGLRSAFNFPFSFYRGVLIGYQKMYFVNIVKISELLSNGILTFFILNQGYGLREMALTTLFVSLSHYAFIMFYSTSKYAHVKFCYANFKFSLLKEVSSFGIFAFAINISVMLLTRTDILVVKYLLPLSAVAIYTIGLKLSDYTIGFSKQFVNALTPLVARLNGAKNKEALERVFLKGTKFSLLISQPIVLGLTWYSPIIIYSWLGTGFEEAVVVSRILLLTSLLTLMQASGSNVLAMTGKERLIAATTFTTALLNIFFSLLLGYYMGLPGIALATLVCALSIDVMIVIPRTLAHLSLSSKTYLKKAIQPVLPGTTTLLGILFLFKTLAPSSTLIGAVLRGGFAFSIYLPVCWFTALTKSEQENYKGKLSKLFQKIMSKLRSNNEKVSLCPKET